MAPRTIRGWLVLWALASLTGAFGTVVRADPIYTVTNLGPGNITFTTGSGATIGGSAGQSLNSDLATIQLVNLSNGLVTYSFSTTPDTALIQGQGALSTVPSNLNVNPNIYSTPEVSGFANGNGLAVLVTRLPITQFPQEAYETAAAYQIGSAGAVDWGHRTTIASSPSGVFAGGNIMIAGINTANQALIGTGFVGQQYNSLLYNISTQSLTNLDSLPAIAAGAYNNLQPIAIDDQGQILVEATTGGSNAGVSLLLTPGGTAPEPFATPEPSALLVGALTAGTALQLVRTRTGPAVSTRRGRINPAE